eukprot:TRINITY_DN600_c0_g1_i1.p1 TRINITY_DN600_c0_g1~~TRINITY_DN600_c0_g1_i1.p1  ORF type:complete len:531 (-),score=145.93 TRINITY_DN600_c0_g1_i1:96-1688(-)
MARFYIYVSLALLFVALQTSVECYEAKSPDQTVNIIHQLSLIPGTISNNSLSARQSFDLTDDSEYTCDGPTRTTWSGKKVCKRLFGTDSDGNPHYVLYAESISKGAAAGIVLCILSIIAFPIFCCGKFLCNCLGGRNRSKGICCGNRDDFEGYSKKEVWGIKIAVFLCMLGIGVAAVVGFTGNSGMNEGLDTLTGTLLDTSHSIINRLDHIGERLSALPYTQDVAETIDNAVAEAQDIVSQVEDVDKQGDQYNKYRSIALILSFALPLLLLVLGVIAALLNVGKLSLAAACFCFLCSMIIWLSFGVHNVVSVVMTDVCFEVNVYLNDESEEGNGTGSPTQALQELIKCTNGGAFSDIQDLATDAIDQAYDTACDALANICSDPNAECPATYQGSTCTRENLELFPAEEIKDYLIGCSDDTSQCPFTGTCTPGNEQICYGQPITVRECADSCMNSDLKDMANTTVTNLDILFEYEDIVDNEILPLLNCTVIKEAFDSMYDALCDTMTGSIARTANASAALGTFLIPGKLKL